MSVAQQPTEGRRAGAGPGAGAAVRWARTERVALWALPALLIVVLTGPMIFAGGPFSGDWPTHLWFVWHQGEALLDDPRPSLFVHYDDGVFYPHFAFYGGTLYTVTGALSAVLGGSGRNAYVLSWVLAYAAAYGGWTWLGRMAGLGRWTAQVPAVLFATSPYLLTITYVRGDWPELVAVSTVPLLVASALSVLRADRLRAGPALALAGSMVIFSGSHNLTLLWGGTFLAVLAAALCAVVPQARRQVTRRGVLRVAALIVPALLVNAWFLVPDAVYQAQTIIASQHADWAFGLRHSMGLVGSGHLFTPLRPTALGSTPGFTLALPVLAMAWVLIAGALGRGRGAWMRVLAVLTALTIAAIVLMTHAGLVLALPRAFGLIQFTYRLESYVLLAVGGAVLAALVLLRDAPRAAARRWRWALVPVLAVAVGGAVVQVHDHPGGGEISSYANPTIGSMGIFASADVPELQRARLARLTFPPARVKHDKITVTARLAPGQLVDTNLMTMPALVHIEGATIVGDHTKIVNAQIRRHAVLQIDPDVTPGAARITISAAHPPTVTIGEVLSLLGIVGLLANAAVMAVRARRRRAARPA